MRRPEQSEPRRTRRRSNAGPPERDQRARRVAIACQGGGAQTAFTAGALQELLAASRRQSADERPFEIVALSGTSGGALCAALAWFELLLGPNRKAGRSRLERFWKSGYPDGVAAESIPDAMAADMADFFALGKWPWRRTLDSLRADLGDWALHQDFPGRWFPYQISARVRPYYVENAFAWIDGALGARETRDMLTQSRRAVAEALHAAPTPIGAPLARMIDDAFELNPLLPSSDIRREFDAQNAFRGLIERVFSSDLAALRRRWARERDRESLPAGGRGGAEVEPITPELLVGAADVNRTVQLDEDTPEGYANRTNFKVFRASENLARLGEMLLASAAVPELMRAVEIDGDHFWDGIFSQNPPILDLPDVHGPTYLGTPGDAEVRAPARHPEEIWLILVNPSTRPDTPRNLTDIDDRKNELSGNISLANEVHSIRKMNDVKSICPLTGRTRRYERIRFRAIEMTESTKLGLELPSKFDRRRINIDPLFDEGRAQAQVFLEQWRGGDAAEGEVRSGDGPPPRLRAVE